MGSKESFIILFRNESGPKLAQFIKVKRASIHIFLDGEEFVFACVRK